MEVSIGSIVMQYMQKEQKFSKGTARSLNLSLRAVKYLDLSHVNHAYRILQKYCNDCSIYSKYKYGNECIYVKFLDVVSFVTNGNPKYLAGKVLANGFIIFLALLIQ
jgi:hypothetical protein